MADATFRELWFPGGQRSLERGAEVGRMRLKRVASNGNAGRLRQREPLFGAREDRETNRL
jgi:hypothetical protein